MLPAIDVYAVLSIQSYLYFLGKSHFGNIYIYRKLIAYVARINNPRDIFKSPLKLTNEKITLFPERSAELDGFKFIRRCIVYLLFSVKAVIGQFSSKWPSPSGRTAKLPAKMLDSIVNAQQTINKN